MTWVGGDIKAFSPDSKLVTPTIDQLAQEGRMFVDAHSPARAPSRYSILSGNYTWRGRDEWGICEDGRIRLFFQKRLHTYQ